MPDHSPSTDERASLAQPSQSSSPLECTSHLGFGLGRPSRVRHHLARGADQVLRHSGRIRMARRMVAAGAPNAAVQRRGRWKHGDMVARYTWGEVAGEALKWLT